MKQLFVPRVFALLDEKIGFLFTQYALIAKSVNLKHIDVGYFKRSEEVMSIMYQCSFDLIRNSKL